MRKEYFGVKKYVIYPFTRVGIKVLVDFALSGYMKNYII